jgi:type II secretory pathway pseudopilin PulG
VSRCRSWVAIGGILIIATALAAVALPDMAEAATLKERLRAAKHALRDSRHRLRNARADLAAALAATTVAVTTAADATGATPSPSSSPSGVIPVPPPSPMDVTPAPTPSPADATSSPSPLATPDLAPTPAVDELFGRVRRARRAVRAWERRVHRLARKCRLRQQMDEWERRGAWMPIIEVAAAKYHVRAAGIYRMMMRESGGQRHAGSSSGFKGLFQYGAGIWTASWNPWRHDSIYDGSSQIFATCYAVSRGMGPSMWTTTFRSLY